VTILAAVLVVASGSAMASEHAAAGHDVKCLKDCQMQVRNCDREVDSLPQRITRLKTEISKGTAVYTTDELRTLERKLKETEELMSNLTFGG